MWFCCLVLFCFAISRSCISYPCWVNWRTISKTRSSLPQIYVGLLMPPKKFLGWRDGSLAKSTDCSWLLAKDWNEWLGYIISLAICLEPGHETMWLIRTERFLKAVTNDSERYAEVENGDTSICNPSIWRQRREDREFKALRRLHPALTLHHRNLSLQWSEVNTKKHQWSRSPDGTSITIPAKARQTLRDRGKRV